MKQKYVAGTDFTQCVYAVLHQQWDVINFLDLKPIKVCFDSPSQTFQQMIDWSMVWSMKCLLCVDTESKCSWCWKKPQEVFNPTWLLRALSSRVLKMSEEGGSMASLGSPSSSSLSLQWKRRFWLLGQSNSLGVLSSTEIRDNIKRFEAQRQHSDVGKSVVE